MQRAAASSSSRNAAVAFIFTVVLIDVIALGIVIPVLPKLVENMMGGDTPRAAEIFGWFGTAWGVMQFVFSPILGALSDRFGRRPVLLISMGGQAVDYALMALAPNLIWLFIGRLLSGVTSASIPTAFAYLADVTGPEQRAQAFGIVGAAFGVGFVVGPALGGVLGNYDPRLPFWVAGACCLANAVYGYFFVPESLAAERRMAFSWRRANPVGSFRLVSTHPELLGLAGVAFLYHLAHNVLPAVAVLYVSYRYGWDTQTIGLTLGVVGIAGGIVQAGLIQPIITAIGERRTLLMGLMFGALGFAIYALAPTGAWFWTGIPVMALWGLAAPAMLGLMTRRVLPSEQGQLQGANASLMAIAGLVGPVLFTYVFAYAIAPQAAWRLPGAPFLLASLLLLAATALAAAVTGAGAAAAGAAKPQHQPRDTHP
jgi:DHA1 family tetracycline resistance protein-like MFS transporter